jgi:hypothetical protein
MAVSEDIGRAELGQAMILNYYSLSLLSSYFHQILSSVNSRNCFKSGNFGFSFVFGKSSSTDVQDSKTYLVPLPKAYTYLNTEGKNGY